VGTPIADAALPSLNLTVTRLLALYASDDYTVAGVIRALETDPAIAARLVRLANSAYYGFERRVDTLPRAVVLLGGVTVQAVALGANLLTTWGGRPPLAAATLWMEAYLCAKACRYLGQRLSAHPHRSAPDALFLTGLLHPIGRLWFLSQSPVEYARLLAELGPSAALEVREVELFGWAHPAAGGALLEAWRFPAPIAANVRHQRHDQLRAELRPDWTVLTAAIAVCRGEPVPAELDLPQDLCDDLAQQVERDRPEAEAFYVAIA